MTTINKGTTVDTIKIQPRELIHIDFAFNNKTYICDFTSMLTVFCENNRMLWVFTMVSKISLSKSSTSY